mmetsp:Transcript_6420/g.16730  ORF Transcript_6420/g.16730 Transcript_6420/m.16730 type:complete len:226 (-) Transcript_6420:63-740(-)
MRRGRGRRRRGYGGGGRLPPIHSAGEQVRLPPTAARAARVPAGAVHAGRCAGGHRVGALKGEAERGQAAPAVGGVDIVPLAAAEHACARDGQAERVMQRLGARRGEQRGAARLVLRLVRLEVAHVGQRGGAAQEGPARGRARDSGCADGGLAVVSVRDEEGVTRRSGRVHRGGNALLAHAAVDGPLVPHEHLLVLEERGRGGGGAAVAHAQFGAADQRSDLARER